MNIVMMTNTYTPHVGGVARSVSAMTEGLRDRGHRVLVVAPVFPDMPADEPDVVRIPAIQNFNGSDFSVVLPVPGQLDEALDAFEPDVIHAHHPFLIGSTALRVAARRGCPLVFTHHTLYEAYTHYVPGDSTALKRFVVALSTSYANSADQVFAPSESIAELLHERGVVSPTAVVPTGIDRAAFGGGDGAAARQWLGIDAGARVMGHVGRLAEEKNLGYLAGALVAAARQDPAVVCLVVGDGPAGEAIDTAFAEAGLADRLVRPGALALPALADAYAAMDVFAFASFTETQGLVLAEAMTAGVPVVALDAAGAREVVNGDNGALLAADTDQAAFARALLDWATLTGAARDRLRQALAETAAAYSLLNCVDRALALYAARCAERHGRPAPVREAAREAWQRNLRGVQAEWAVLRGMARAAGKALGPDTGSDGFL
ncbi:glycosyltransferase [Spiribacter vilamensis]|uniref:Glycosyltransferase involved in cell wall biosynthesis n=1 Tax=Spiribacter vilamensis TaxID=531306 RepID=A0A4Q8D2V1_9GAMM|nr:glycosyltransferase [Spiribacter vilamensis]RZU99650.1 glycosyltransferase involved in cell wall biosynthesis [Spiribacter vilamensis]TVO61394.1 glycosyltransferase family 4 protein [Spiribacter vilamensis]